MPQTSKDNPITNDCTPKDPVLERAYVNCPSSYSKIGEEGQSGGPWLAVIGGMRVVVSDRGRVGLGSGDGETRRVAVTGGGTSAKMAVPILEAPLALARNREQARSSSSFWSSAWATSRRDSAMSSRSAKQNQ
jgi:hypothetical protein